MKSSCPLHHLAIAGQHRQVYVSISHYLGGYRFEWRRHFQEFYSADNISESETWPGIDIIPVRQLSKTTDLGTVERGVLVRAFSVVTEDEADRSIDRTKHPEWHPAHAEN